jgi:hypothetical protein
MIDVKVLGKYTQKYIDMKNIAFIIYIWIFPVL